MDYFDLACDLARSQAVIREEDLVIQPDYVVSVWDNGGVSADRYTVCFRDGSYLAMDYRPTWPQGIAFANRCYLLRGPDDFNLEWSDLPASCREYAIQWYNDGN